MQSTFINNIIPSFKLYHLTHFICDFLRPFINISSYDIWLSLKIRRYMSSLEGQNKPISSEEQGAMGEHKQMNVALVSDFYYPFVGGVEIHIK